MIRNTSRCLELTLLAVVLGCQFAFGLEVVIDGSTTEDDGFDSTREPAYVRLLRSPHMTQHSTCCAGNVGIFAIAHEYRCTPDETNELLGAFAQLRGSHNIVEFWPDTDDDGKNYIIFEQLRDYWPGGFNPEYLRERREIPEPDWDKHVNTLRITISRAESLDRLELP